jgi:hypothetical protein
MAWDASLLKFELPELGQRLSWGCAGYEEARQWPLLPSGIMEAGDRIPRNDPRWVWITIFCGTIIPILDEQTLFQAYKESHSFQEYRSHRFDRLLDGVNLVLDVADYPEKNCLVMRSVSSVRPSIGLKRGENQGIGRPSISGMGIAVADVFGWLPAGMSYVETDYPELNEQDIRVWRMQPTVTVAS